MLKKKNLDPEKEAELQKEPKEKGDVPAMLLDIAKQGRRGQFIVSTSS